ncbi:MAG: lysylphosphatidylglycerol synthase transmembrane domain-containing protein [Anaerolineaceae bacterium]
MIETEKENRLNPPENKTSWQFWLGISLSIGCSVLALWGIDIEQVVNALKDINWWNISVALFAVTLVLFLKTHRWTVLLGLKSFDPFNQVFKRLVEGAFLNTFLPARLGDLARVVLLGEELKMHKAYILGTIILEKTFDLLAVGLAVVYLFFKIDFPDWMVRPAQTIFILLVGVLLVSGFVYWLDQKQNQKLNHWVRKTPFLQKVSEQWGLLVSSFKQLRDPVRIFKVSAWTLIINFIGLIPIYFVLVAMNIELPIWTMLFLWVVLQIGIAVPSSPGRVGVFHYVVVLGLLYFNIERSAALAYAVVLHLCIYLPLVILGAIVVGRDKMIWQKMGDLIHGKN